MESQKVKELRELYGIHDELNEYTEEQIENLSKQMLYYVTYSIDMGKQTVNIFHKHIPGYISTDVKACIFIKDEEITNKPWYMPMKNIIQCENLKDGIYQYCDVIICTTDELDFCLSYTKTCIDEELETLIQEAENHIKTLKNMKMQIPK